MNLRIVIGIIIGKIIYELYKEKNDIKEIENMKNERIWIARSENASPVLGIIEKIMPKGNEIKNSLLTELKYKKMNNLQIFN